MRRKVFISIVLTLLCIAVVPISAQEDNSSFFDEHPLFEMMSYIPSNEWLYLTRVFYQDFHIGANAVDFIPSYESTQEAIDADWEGFFEVFRRYFSTPESMMSPSPRNLEAMLEIMGFDFLDIQYTMELGWRNNTTTVWRGEFDEESIINAHLARDYTETEMQGLSVMCAPTPIGCENGDRPDASNRLLGHLFDDTFGRYPPFIILPNIIISAFELADFESAVEVVADQIPSMADVDIFRALGESILDPNKYSGDLIQAQFHSGANFPFYADFVNERFSPNPMLNLRSVEAWMIGFFEGYGELPEINFVVFADRQEGDTQVELMGLVYDNEADAQLAATEMRARLGTDSWMGNSGLRENLDFAIITEPYVYYSETTGLYVAMNTIESPTPLTPIDPDVPNNLLFAPFIRHWMFNLDDYDNYLFWQVTLPE